MYLHRLCGMALLVMVGPASAQEQRTSGNCAGLAENSVEAAIRSCHGEVVDPEEAALLGQDPLSEVRFSSDEPFGDFIDPSRASTILEGLREASPLAPSATRAGPLVQIDGEDWALEQQRLRSSRNDAAEPAAQEVAGVAPTRLVPLTPTAEPHVEVDGQLVSMDVWLEGSFLDRLVGPVEVEIPDEGEAFASTRPPATETRHSAVIDGVTVELDLVSYELLELILRSAGMADIEEAPTAQPEVLEELRE